MFPFVSVASASDVALPTTRVQNPPAAPSAPEAPEVPPATLTFDCKVPAEILVDGVKLGQLWFSGVSSWKVAPGHHVARIYVAGTPDDHALDVRSGDALTFLVGRTGTTLSDSGSAAPVAAGPSRVGFRVVGAAAVELRVDDVRTLVKAGTEHVLDLPAGSHPLSLRNADGTAIWSTGVLEVTGGTAIVQLSEGRMPEVSGGAVFHAGG